MSRPNTLHFRRDLNLTHPLNLPGLERRVGWWIEAGKHRDGAAADRGIQVDRLMSGQVGRGLGAARGALSSADLVQQPRQRRQRVDCVKARVIFGGFRVLVGPAQLMRHEDAPAARVQRRADV